MQSAIDLQFADGAYSFKLGLAQIRELQDKTKTGVGALYARMLQGRMGDKLEDGHPAFAAYHVDDLRETVRQALIGGAQGMVDGALVPVTSLRATELVERYLDPMPLTAQWNLATSILYALVEGYSDEQSDNDLDEAEAGDEDKKKAGGLTTPAP